MKISKPKTKKFIEVCKEGDLRVIKSLLDINQKTCANMHHNQDEGFRLACANGHLPVVQYLLTSPELKKHADIHAKDDYGLRWACANGHLPVVQYLLTSPELSEYANIHVFRNSALLLTCTNGHFHIVKYLLTFDVLVTSQNIEFGYQLAGIHNNFDIMNYLLAFSFYHKQIINFEKLDFNIDWALSENKDDIIIGITRLLKRYDFVQYVECLPKIEQYSFSLYERIRKDNPDDAVIGISEDVLYI